MLDTVGEGCFADSFSAKADEEGEEDFCQEKKLPVLTDALNSCSFVGASFDKFCNRLYVWIVVGNIHLISVGAFNSCNLISPKDFLLHR